MLVLFALSVLCSTASAAPTLSGELPATRAAATPDAPSASTPGPIVDLGYAKFEGSNDAGVVNFLGMPYAQPPLGDLRFALPLPPLNLGAEIIQATARGSMCFQMQNTDGLADGVPSSALNTFEAAAGLTASQSGVEDCLFINVQGPASSTPGTLYPTVVWLYGGGFEFGEASYDATPLIARSVALGSPVIVVSMNYRLSAFGFLAGEQVKAAGAGNAGMHDQRLAFRWVQEHISKFGGDPSRVLAWGESAGSFSVALHMIAYDGDLTQPHSATSNSSLFQAAFCESGAQLPTGSILNGQNYYDDLATATGCTDSDSFASLDCLRLAPYEQLVAAVDQTPGILSYQSHRLAWQPRSDGSFIKQDAQQLVAEGKIAKIPIVIGDCEDEGTLFAASSANVTTDAEAMTYFQTVFLTGSTDAEIAELALHYPQDPTVGSPYNTGLANQLTPQFKRIASFIGDYTFESPRRFFLQALAKLGNEDVWVYKYARGKATPFFGSVHSGDLEVEFQAPKFGGADNQGLDFLISFAVRQNPNSPTSGNSSLHWPRYAPSSPYLMTFLDRPLGGILGLSITLDTYRQAAMEYLTFLSRKYPV